MASIDDQFEGWVRVNCCANGHVHLDILDASTGELLISIPMTGAEACEMGGSLYKTARELDKKGN